MNQALIPFEDLKQLFGGNNPADVAVRLKNAGVKFKLGVRGRPFTTVDAINDSMGMDKIQPHIVEVEERTIEVG